MRGSGGGIPGVSQKLDDVAPSSVLMAFAGVAAFAGVLFALNTGGEMLSDVLFQWFMYVVLPVVVVLGGVRVRRSDLPGEARWHVVRGYLAGGGFIAVLVIWASIPDLMAGDPLVSLVDSIVFFGNMGGVFGFVAGVSRAQTEYNRQLRDDLEEQNERLDRFASLLAHDLRNPLNVALMELELLEERASGDAIEGFEEGTASIAEALERSNQLVDDVLTLAREGEQVQDPSTVDLSAVADAAWDNVATREAELQVASPPRVHADEPRLQQALENLFRNAVEHAGPEVTVTVGALEDGFYVGDDGPGIPEAERERVFEAGYSGTREGTGLGLDIVESIVDAHGWTVTTTEGDDGGARFEIRGLE